MLDEDTAHLTTATTEVAIRVIDVSRQAQNLKPRAQGQLDLSTDHSVGLKDKTCSLIEPLHRTLPHQTTPYYTPRRTASRAGRPDPHGFYSYIDLPSNRSELIPIL